MTDIGGMATLVAAIGQNQRRALMLIYGRMNDQPMAGFHLYESHTRAGTNEFITVGVAQVPLETPVV